MFKLDDNCKNVIILLEDLKLIIKKINKVQIDVEILLCIVYDVENKVGIVNLMGFYFVVIGKIFVEIEVQYVGVEMYGLFKKDVGEVVVVMFEFV